MSHRGARFVAFLHGLDDLIGLFRQPTTGDVVARLVRKGFIDRRASTEDRRKKLLSLTRKGKSTLARVRPYVDNSQEVFLATLSAMERENVNKLLFRLAIHDHQK